MILVVDYGMGNLRSVINAFERLGAEIEVSDRAEDVRRAEKIVLPGVGAVGEAMAELRRRDLPEDLHQAVLVERKPVLGICLGMQLLARRSEEGDVEGLAWLDADVMKLQPGNPEARVPHIGWNDLIWTRPGRLNEGIDEAPTAYFVHSYHLVAEDPSIVTGHTEHGGSWVAAIEHENIYGVQFHPEKSHDVGLRMLSNFVAI